MAGIISMVGIISVAVHALVCDIIARSSFIVNITFVLCSKRSKKSKRRTFAFKVRLLLFLAYREGTLNLDRACLSWLHKEILHLNITFLVLACLAFTFDACLY